MQKESLVLVLGLIGITGWVLREPIMSRINPTAPVVNTSDLAPEGSVYRESGKQDAPHSASGIYSWKDREGKTHFGNRAEPRDAEEVVLSKGNTVSLSVNHPAKRPDDKPATYNPGTQVPGSSSARAALDKTRQTLHGAAMQQQAEIGVMNEANQ